MLSAFPSSLFKQSSHNGIRTKIVNKDSIRTIIVLGTLVSESFPKISTFHAPTDSEHKFHKARIENWPPIELGNWDFPWLGIRRHNHCLGSRWVGVPLLGTRSSKSSKKFSNPWGNTRKSYSPPLPPLSWLTPETITKNLRFTQRSYLAQLYQEQKEEPIS